MRVFHGTTIHAAGAIGGQLAASQFVTAKRAVAVQYARRAARASNRMAGLDPNDATSGAVLCLEVEPAALEVDREDPGGIGEQFVLRRPPAVVGVERVTIPAIPSRELRGVFTLGRFRT
jgi:hypothetical protein